MSAMASQSTSPTIVYSADYSGADQRKHLSPALLAFVRGIHRWPVNYPHKEPVTRKMFPFDDVVMIQYFALCWRKRPVILMTASENQCYFEQYLSVVPYAQIMTGYCQFVTVLLHKWWCFLARHGTYAVCDMHSTKNVMVFSWSNTFTLYRIALGIPWSGMKLWQKNLCYADKFPPYLVESFYENIA